MQFASSIASRSINAYIDTPRIIMRRPKKIRLKLKQIVEYRRIARSVLEKRSLKQSRFLERAASFDRDFEPVGGLAGASKHSPKCISSEDMEA